MNLKRCCSIFLHDATIVSIFISPGKTLDIFRKGENMNPLQSGHRWDTGVQVQCRGTKWWWEGRGVEGRGVVK